MVCAELYQHGDFTGWKVVFPTGDYNHDAMVAAGAHNDDLPDVTILILWGPGGPEKSPGGAKNLPEGVAPFSQSMGPWRAMGTPFLADFMDFQTHGLC